MLLQTGQQKPECTTSKPRGSDLTPGNGEQLIEVFLKSKEVNIAQFEPPSEVHPNSENGLTGKKRGKFVTKPTMES